MKFLKKIAGLLYRITKRVLRIQSWYLHHYACYLNGLRVWKYLRRNGEKFIDIANFKAYKKYWQPLCSIVPGVFYKEYSTLTGQGSKYFVPENIYFTIIEPILNNPTISSAYEDKAIIDWLHKGNYFPKIILRNIHGAFYSAQGVVIAEPDLTDILVDYKKVIAKPSIGSQGGKNIYLFEKQGDSFVDEDGQSLSIEFLKKRFRMNFIVQEYVHQHVFFHQFNASSVNTLRVMTYRSVNDETVHVLHVVLRVGEDGSVVDNQSSGGFVCGIDAEGILKNYAINKNGKIVNSLSNGQINLTDRIPVFMIEEVRKLAIETAKRHLHSRLLGFDFCVDSNGNIKLIEVNNMDLAIDFIQQVNGPLFGNFTDEIKDYCIKQKSRLKYRII